MTIENKLRNAAILEYKQSHPEASMGAIAEWLKLAGWCVITPQAVNAILLRELKRRQRNDNRNNCP